MLVYCCGVSPVLSGLFNQVCHERDLKILFFSSIEEALSYAKEDSDVVCDTSRTPAIVFFDVDSEDEKSPDLITALRASFSDVAVVPVVDSRFVDYTKEAMLRGALGFLEKPCNKEVIEEIIKIALFSRS